MTGLTLTTTFVNHNDSSYNNNLTITPPRSRNNSTTSSSDAPLSPCHSVSLAELTCPELKVVMNSDSKLILRPNHVYRGSVRLRTPKAAHASQIRVKFRGVECATVKVKEAGIDTKLERIDKITTTYFDVETKVWGNETSAFSISSWQTLEPGEYEFPFALKIPNVNFPPSIEDPTGFSIRYIWTAFLDGPANHPGLRSDDLVTTYRPLLCAPRPTPWTYSETLYKEKKTPLASVSASLSSQVFFPDQTANIELQINTIPSDMIISGISYKLRKCYEGKLLLQRGTVHRLYKRDLLQMSVPVAGNRGSLQTPIRVQIPSRLVSPCFTSHHIRVYYYIVIMIMFETGNLLKSTHHARFEIPIGMANIAHDNLIRIHDLASVQHYSQSKEGPYFFDPSLESAPITDDIPMYDTTSPPAAAAAAVQMSDDWIYENSLDSPPSYCSLEGSSQFIKRERVEKTVYTSRLVKPNVSPELGEPLTLTPYTDNDW